MSHPFVRLSSSVGIACLIAGVSTFGLAEVWKLIGGGALPLHGWIAMGLGVLGTVGLTWVLMQLAFRSHRDGWDDQVDNSLDPGRDGKDDEIY